MDSHNESFDGGSPKLYQANSDMEDNDLFDIEAPHYLQSRLPFQSPEREPLSDPAIKMEAEYVGFGSDWRPFSKTIIEFSNSETEGRPEPRPEQSSSNPVWVQMPNQIDLTGLDNGHAATLEFKQEDRATGFDWTIMPERIDLLSDGELEVLETHGSGVHQMSMAGKVLSRQSKINTYKTPGYEKKLEELQKKLTEKVRKRAVAAGASISQGDTGPVGYNQGVPIDVDSDSDLDAQTAIGFHKLKKTYFEKCQSKANTFEDDVMWTKAKNAELARMKRVKKELRINVQDSEDELFISQAGSSTYRLAHRDDQAQRQGTRRGGIIKDVIDVRDVQNSSDTEEMTQGKLPNKRSQQKQMEKDEHVSMQAGIEDFLQKEANKEARKRKRRSGVSSHPRKRKDKSKGKEKMKKPKPTEAGYLLNTGSLMTSATLYEDANINLNQPLAPKIVETRKEEALKQLLANVPMEDLRQARSEKAHLLRATKTLGKHGRCKVDGNSWRLKGIISSVKFDQLLMVGNSKAWLPVCTLTKSKELHG